MPILETIQLNFNYGKQHAIADLNLQVPKGSIYGFLGPNGAGKSTTIKLLLGLLTPHSGEVRYFDKNLRQHKLELLARTGNLIETPSVYGHLTAWENLQYLDALFKKGKNRIEEVLELVDLSPAKDKKVQKFSMGMKQRLGIAMALFHDPEILILDEPVNGLDPSGIQDMRRLFLRLQEAGKTILVSSHLLAEVEKLCTHLGIINHGRLIFQGTMHELLQTAGRKLRIRTDDPQQAQILCRKAGIELTLTPQQLLETNASDDAIANQIVRLLVEHRLEVYAVEEALNSLEDLFITLTKKEKPYVAALS